MLYGRRVFLHSDVRGKSYMYFMHFAEHGPIGRLRSSNCNSDTIAFAGASCRAVPYFTLSVGVFFLRAKSTESGNSGSSARTRNFEHQNFKVYCFSLHFLYTQCATTKLVEIIALFIEFVLRFLLTPKL